MQNKLVQRREADHGRTGDLHQSKRKRWIENHDPDYEWFPRQTGDSTAKVSWDKSRDWGETARTSVTISGWYRGGGESRKKMREPSYQDRPHRGFGSKSLLAPEGAKKANPTRKIYEEPSQEDFNPAPWRKPPEQPKPTEAAEKGARPMRHTRHWHGRAGRGEGCQRWRL